MGWSVILGEIVLQFAQGAVKLVAVQFPQNRSTNLVHRYRSVVQNRDENPRMRALLGEHGSRGRRPL